MKRRDVYRGVGAGVRGFFDTKPHRYNRNLGRRSRDLALISESKAVLGNNEALSQAEIKQAQRKALIRAKAAQAITLVGSVPVVRSLAKPVTGQVLNRVVL